MNISDEKNKVLRNCKRRTWGETITEVLVTSLIISLSLVMLISMVTASVRIVKKSEQWYDNFYTASNILEKGEKLSSIPNTVNADYSESGNAENTLSLDNNNVLETSILNDSTIEKWGENASSWNTVISASLKKASAEAKSGSEKSKVELYEYEVKKES